MPFSPSDPMGELTKKPRFRTLQKVDRQAAVETFERNKDFYHPICRAMVEKDLFGSKSA
jgi:leukotriene-A4 hydrolase